MAEEKEDIVIYDSSLTTDQLRLMWGNGDEEGFVEYTKEEIDQLAEDINDAIHQVIEDFLNHRSV
jgi:hypothetical protein